MKKNSFWRIDSKFLENFRMFQWKLDHLPDFFDFFFHAANVFVCNVEINSSKTQKYCFWIKQYFCVLVDEARLCRNGVYYHESYLLKTARKSLIKEVL